MSARSQLRVGSLLPGAYPDVIQSGPEPYQLHSDSHALRHSLRPPSYTIWYTECQQVVEYAGCFPSILLDRSR